LREEEEEEDEEEEEEEIMGFSCFSLVGLLSYFLFMRPWRTLWAEPFLRSPIFGLKLVISGPTIRKTTVSNSNEVYNSTLSYLRATLISRIL